MDEIKIDYKELWMSKLEDAQNLKDELASARAKIDTLENDLKGLRNDIQYLTNRNAALKAEVEAYQFCVKNWRVG